MPRESDRLSLDRNHIGSSSRITACSNRSTSSDLQPQWNFHTLDGESEEDRISCRCRNVQPQGCQCFGSVASLLLLLWWGTDNCCCGIHTFSSSHLPWLVHITDHPTIQRICVCLMQPKTSHNCLLFDDGLCRGVQVGLVLKASDSKCPGLTSYLCR